MRRILPIVVALPLGALGALSPPRAAAVEPGTAPVLQPSRPPSEIERRRMVVWFDLWRREAAELERAVGALRSRDGGRPVLRHGLCMDLAAALLDLDRSVVLPAPDAAVSIHLEDGLRRLARAALTCLTRRPHAARHALERSDRAFRQAAGLLERHGLPPEGLGSLAP